MSIKNVGGKWHSEVTIEERELLLAQELEKFSPAERECLQQLLTEINNNEVDFDDVKSISLLETLNKVEYERPVVSPEQWIEDPYYFGDVGKSLYPILKKDFIELMSGDYQEVVLTGSIGWGKTHFASICLNRMVYELTCMKSPQESFGLSKGSSLVFPNYSVTEAVSKKVIFGNVLDQMQKSPYFVELGIKKTQKEIRIPSKNIVIMALPASQRSALGMNVFGAIVDETNFIRLPQQTNAALKRWERVEADTLYTSLSMRIKSRFLRFGRVPGLLFLVSSKTSDDAFIERKLIESRADPKIFARDYALYEVRPEAYAGSKRFKVLVGKGRVRSRILKADDDVSAVLEEYEGTRVVEVPEDFLPEFERSLEEALRDVAGVSTESISPFIHRTEKIYESADKKRPHPFSCVEYDPMSPHDGFCWDLLVEKNKEGAWQPKVNPDAPRHVHIDPSMLVRGGDATGMAVGHICEHHRTPSKHRNHRSISHRRTLVYVLRKFKVQILQLHVRLFV